MGASSGTLRKRLQAAAVEAMLDSAERVMTRRGYEKATMQQIAAGAGCAAGTFYLYFRTKQVLFEAIAARHARAMFGQARAAMAKSDDPLERVRLGLSAMLRYGQRHRGFFRLFFTALPMRHRLIRQQLGGVSRRESDLYNQAELERLRQAQAKRLVRSDLPAETLQSFIDDVAFGFVEQFAFSRRGLSADEQLRILWGLIAGGLRAGN